VKLALTRHPRTPRLISLPFLKFIHLFDLVRVAVDRFRHGRPVYVGDNNHLSHLLVQRGLGNVQAVALIWLAALVLGALSLFL
jgi:UDP-N-acetylmuramyl pentapeptide phosphotransferase/UDP-N-acetylglucosamine-1-phosphate transferase